MSSSSSSDPIRPLFDHLNELRSRLIWVLATIALLSIVGYHLSDLCFYWMARQTGPMVFLTPTEGFSAKMKLSVLLGAFMAVPVILFHAWRFIGIALTGSERRIMSTILPMSYLLFTCGAILGWFVVVPAALRFLVGFGSSYLSPNLSVESCLQFSLWVTAGLGLLFQLPIVIAALVYWGIVTPRILSDHRRHVVVGIFVAAAVVTPGPDVVSQLLLAIPTYVLFELSVLVAKLIKPQRD